VPPIDAITAKVVSLGGTVSSSVSNDLTAGPNLAKRNDVAIVFANAMSGELGAYDIVVGNMGDRNDLNLWWDGQKLVREIIRGQVYL
jgi:beta-glucosidase